MKVLQNLKAFMDRIKAQPHVSARLTGVMRRLADYSDSLVKDGKLPAAPAAAASLRLQPPPPLAATTPTAAARSELDSAFMPPSQRLRELQQSKLAAAQGTPAAAAAPAAAPAAASPAASTSAGAAAQSIRALVLGRVEHVLARPWLLLLVLGAVPPAKLAARLSVLATPLRELQVRVVVVAS